ncbi:MAG TPA: DUF1007 family protein, partial [Hyphomicrobiales bacterium]|nr:DUF1007 family protein [Hyphomicrobiales bacterium]
GGEVRLAILSAWLVLALMAFAGPASAHPHVWVTTRSTIVFDKAGAPTAIRQEWRFDEMFSAFAVQGLDKNHDGKYSRAELADLAHTNVTSLADFGYFTFVKEGKAKYGFKAPTDYWLSYDGHQLTLHFTLPFAQAPPAGTSFAVEIYDPTIFVDFELEKTRAAALQDAPKGCGVKAYPPAGGDMTAQTSKISESFFTQLTARSSYGERYANVIAVTCAGGHPAVAAAPVAPPPPPVQRDAKAPTIVVAPLPAEDATVADAPGDDDPAYEESDEASLRDVPIVRVETAWQMAWLRPMAALPAPPKPAAPPPSPAAAPGSAALGAFGILRPDGAGPGSSRFFGWIVAEQARFYQALSHALSRSRADGSALLLLAGLSFAYGVFHAAGPGHGKTVIASYLVATGETFRRGVALSFAAAGAQALCAIAIVSLFAVLLGLTGKAIGLAAWWLEAASYAVVMVLGAMLVWRKAAALVAALAPGGGRLAVATPGGGGFLFRHAHVPEPATLAGRFDWRRAASAVVAVGIRPCSGALIILVFALAQGLLWTGIAATLAMAVGTALTVTLIATLAVTAKAFALRLASVSPGGGGAVLVHGCEVLAGLVVLAFGATFLVGLLLGGAAYG